MQAEVSFVATVPATGVPAIRGLLERWGCEAVELRAWERTFRSTLSPSKRGLGEVRLSVNLGAPNALVLRTESQDRLALSHLVAPRTPACMQARRIANVQVAVGAPHFLASLGFSLAHETLKRGFVAHQEGATICVFELCRRTLPTPAAEASPELGPEHGWQPLGDGTWLVELRVLGDDLKPLAATADTWADLLAPLATLQPIAPLSGR